MRLLLLLLVACGSPSAPIVANQATPVPAAGSYCPLIPVTYWTHELFPACQAPPLLYAMTLCGGAPCPQPCGMQWTKLGGNINTADLKSGSSEFRYDAQGRLVSERTDSGESDCTYDAAGRLTSCGTMIAERDPTGRLLKIMDGGRVIEIAYDGPRVVRVGDRELEYANGRIVKINQKAVEWSGDRVVRETYRDQLTELDVTRDFVYDERGWMRKITMIEQPTAEHPTPPPTTFEVAYDGNRVAGMQRTYGDEGRNVRFLYDCKK
jgi:YD repeat-containing protein